MVSIKLNYHIVSCFISILLLSNCTSINHKKNLDLSKTNPQSELEDQTKYEVIASTQSSKMKQVISNSGNEDELYDLLLITQAQDLENHQKHNFATKYWVNAISYAQDDIGEYAIQGLADNLRALNTSENLLVHSIMEKFLEIKQNTFIDRYAYRNPLRLKKLLNKKKSPHPKNLVDSEATVSNFDLSSEILSDPLLIKSAKKICKKKSPRLWELLLSDLPLNKQSLWSAHKLECLKKSNQAAEKFKKFALDNYDSDTEIGRVVFALSKAARQYGRSKEHKTSSELYQKLYSLFKNKSIKPSSLNMSKSKFNEFKANQSLWASRYIALNNEYKVATKIALAARSSILSELSKSKGKKQKKVWSELYSEAAHVLSFRIYLEQDRLNQAIKANQVAINHPSISKQWKNRLIWYQSIFAYLSSDYTLSQQKASLLNSITTQERYKIKSLFILALIAVNNSNRAKAQEIINQISTTYPSSYYNVVAARSLAEKHNLSWQSRIDTNIKQPASELFSFNKNMFKNNELNKLDIRAKALIQAKYPDIAKEIVQHLKVKIKENRSDLKFPETTLYWNSLAHHSNIFQSPMRSTMILSNHNKDFFDLWPEQLQVSFPKPFASDYINAARQTSVKENLLLAISRQESLFQKDALSAANAYGVMQIIEPTAKKYARSLSLDTSNITNDLLESKVNILIGAKFISELSNMFNHQTPHIVAAYNAGEHAVNKWLKYRDHQDPLVWIELIPYGETQKYTKLVLRNLYFYDEIYNKSNSPAVALKEAN